MYDQLSMDSQSQSSGLTLYWLTLIDFFDSISFNGKFDTKVNQGEQIIRWHLQSPAISALYVFIIKNTPVTYILISQTCISNEIHEVNPIRSMSVTQHVMI